MAALTPQQIHRLTANSAAQPISGSLQSALRGNNAGGGGVRSTTAQFLARPGAPPGGVVAQQTILRAPGRPATQPAIGIQRPVVTTGPPQQQHGAPPVAVAVAGSARPAMPQRMGGQPQVAAQQRQQIVVSQAGAVAARQVVVASGGGGTPPATQVRPGQILQFSGSGGQQQIVVSQSGQQQVIVSQSPAATVAASSTKTSTN